MTETTSLAPLKAQVLKLENKANEITITTAEENATATELKAKLNETKKQIKDRKEEITKLSTPRFQAHAHCSAPIEDSSEKAESILARKLIAYKQKVKRRPERPRTNSPHEEKGTMKLETAERKIDALPTVQKQSKPTTAECSLRKIKKVRITNPDLVPDQYWVLNEVLIRKDALVSTPDRGCQVSRRKSYNT